MKRLRKIFCVALVLALTLCACVGLAAETAPQDERLQWSMDWLKNALSGQVDESVLTGAMVQTLEPQGGLTALLAELIASAGSLQAYGEPTGGEQQGMYVTLVLLTFEKMAVQATLVVDGDGKLAGLSLQPVVEAAAVPLPQGATAEEVTVDAGTGYPLGGALTLPSASQEKLPAALLVWGSGANDRDEIVGANRVFAQLASALAERGIITLRFDKRTSVYSDVSAADPSFSIQEEYSEDVLAALKLLKADPRVDEDRVYLIGHSQGAMLAPRLASQGVEVAGLVLMAGSPRDLTDILFDQEMSTLQGIDAPEQKALYEGWYAEAQQIFTLDADAAKAHSPLYSGAFGAYYLWDMHQFDAITLLKSLRLPTLILQGGNDLQIYADVDYTAYQNALKDEAFATFKLYPGLSHLFMPSAAKTLTDAMLEYNQPAQIPAEVLNDLAVFVNGR